jgi:amidophosphoribosyltransferase
MCGITGLFLKDPSLEPRLGELYEPMLVAMTERGPDSAGIAVYRNRADGERLKYSLYSPDSSFEWDWLDQRMRKEFPDSSLVRIHKYGILTSPLPPKDLRSRLSESAPSLRVMGMGKEMEIFKDVGAPAEIARRYGIGSMRGTCIIGHTRMATESAVNVEGSHPYTSGNDLCLVHNGSYSNHNSIRRVVEREGLTFDSWNDTEVAARYVQWRLEKGDDLKEALHRMVSEFSGFFTLTIGLPGQFAVMRDAFACKPMVVAETDRYVACGSEFRALAHLPEVMNADIFEPQPEEIQVWSRSTA